MSSEEGAESPVGFVDSVDGDKEDDDDDEDDSVTELKKREKPPERRLGKNTSASDISHFDETEEIRGPLSRRDQGKLGALTLANTKLPSLGGDEIETGTRLAALSTAPASARMSSEMSPQFLYLAKQEHALSSRRTSLSRSAARQSPLLLPLDSGSQKKSTGSSVGTANNSIVSSMMLPGSLSADQLSRMDDANSGGSGGLSGGIDEPLERRQSNTPPSERGENQMIMSNKPKMSPLAAGQVSVELAVNEVVENPEDMQDRLDQIRRASRRKWWSPTRCMDWCMHKSLTGKLFVLLLSWTSVVDYAKDIYVLIHLSYLQEWMYFWMTLSILYLSSRLMLQVRVSGETPSLWLLFLFYPPGSMVFDSPLDRKSDVALCFVSELLLDLCAPFMPLYLLYLSVMKTAASLLPDVVVYEHHYLLSFSVIECVFETFPQLCLQTTLYVLKKHNNRGQDIPLTVFVVAGVVSALVLIKIPLIIWWNRRIVYKLQFKRKHESKVSSVRFHPFQDIVSTGSSDQTVLINHIIADSILKAKRVLTNHSDVNCVCWSYDGDYLAVGGRSVQVWDWRNSRVIYTFPKKYSRNNPLRKKKRNRTHEVVDVAFASDGKSLCFAQGKYLYIWDFGSTFKERFRIRVIQNDGSSVTVFGEGSMIRQDSGQSSKDHDPAEDVERRKRRRRKLQAAMDSDAMRKDSIPCDVLCVAVSPNSKYCCAGTLIGTIKMYDLWSGEMLRIFHGHSQAVNQVQFDQEGQWIVSCSADHTVRMFDIVGGEQVKQFDQHDTEVTCLSIDYSNRFVVSADKDGVIQMSYLLHESEQKAVRRISVWAAGGGSHGTHSAGITGGSHGISGGGPSSFLAQHQSSLNRSQRGGTLSNAVTPYHRPHRGITAPSAMSPSTASSTANHSHSLLNHALSPKMTSLELDAHISHYINNGPNHSNNHGSFLNHSQSRDSGMYTELNKRAVTQNDLNVEVLEMVAVPDHVFELPIYSEVITSVDFSPYGASIAVGFENGQATLLELPGIFSMREVDQRRDDYFDTDDHFW